jgi:hypothetical protein
MKSKEKVRRSVCREPGGRACPVGALETTLLTDTGNKHGLFVDL